MNQFIIFFAALLLLCSTSPELKANTYSTEKSSFNVTIKNNTSPYRIVSAFVMPSEKLTISCSAPEETARFTLGRSFGKQLNSSSKKIEWQAPAQKGVYKMEIIRLDKPDTVKLHIFVLVAAIEQKGEYLNGYRIGNYEKYALRGLEIYKPPMGFVEVTEETKQVHVSPHFTLGQFICKQSGGYPIYVVLRQRLLLKLELILEQINLQIKPYSSLVIMSGYRTPYYNKAIGNVKYSRHVYGGASDIYIDQYPADGLMDDINNDGQISWKDGKVLYDIVDNLYGHTFYEKFIGGLGRYKKTANHGPFVHVDVRGFRARWGD